MVVAITGGARGIGRATAEACLRAGHRVAIADLDLALTEETARAIGAEAFAVDVTDRDSFAAFLDGVEERLGPLDVLVNNAGVFFLGLFDVGLTRALRGEIRGSGVRTTIVMPGIIRTDMIGGFAVPRGIRTVGPEVVAEAIVDALRSGREEVIVPRETTVLARLAAVLPPRASDAFKRALKADRILAGADRSQRADYERRLEAENQAR